MTGSWSWIRSSTKKELGVGDEVAALGSSRSSCGMTMVVIDSVAHGGVERMATRRRSSREEG